MKVKAEHWVKVNGTWYQAGQTYDDGKPEIAEPTTEPEVEVEQPAPEKKRSGRKKT